MQTRQKSLASTHRNGLLRMFQALVYLIVAGWIIWPGQTNSYADGVWPAVDFKIYLPIVARQVWRPFADSSPWNAPIPANAEVDPNSPAMIAQFLQSRDPRFWINIYRATVPIWYADSSTPKYNLACTEGNCRDLVSVPIPNNAVPDPASDAHMLIIDRAQNRSWDMWKAQKTANGWMAGWGTTFDLGGSGTKPLRQSSARATGLPLAGGLILLEEMKAGRINHALVFSYDYPGNCLVYPASTNGGQSTDPNAIPFGARLQLDPLLDLNSLGLSPGAIIVARALQEYGMYVGDNGGVGPGLYAQLFPNPTPDPWAGVLKENDLVKLPTNKFRVLKLGPKDCYPD